MAQTLTHNPKTTMTQLPMYLLHGMKKHIVAPLQSDFDYQQAESIAVPILAILKHGDYHPVASPCAYAVLEAGNNNYFWWTESFFEASNKYLELTGAREKRPINMTS